MSLAIVQHTSGHGTGNGTFPHSLTLGSTPGVGNLIVVFLFTNISSFAALTVNTASYTVADNAGPLYGSAVLYGTTLFRYVQGGDTTALPNFCTAGNTYWAAVVYEISGVSGSIDSDLLSVVELQGTSSSYTTTQMVTVANNSLALAGYAEYDASSNPSISGAGWTQDEAGNNSANYGDWGGASNPISTSGSVAQLTITFPNAINNVYLVVLLSPSSATSPTVRQVRGVANQNSHPGVVTLPTPPVTGNLLIANFSWGDGASSANPAIGSGWTLITAATNSSFDALLSYYRYVQAGDASGLPALTTSGINFWGLDIFEIAGVTGTIANDLASSKVGYQSTGATMTTTSDTTTANNQLGLATFANYDGTNLLTSGSSGYDFVRNDVSLALFGSWGTLRQYFPSSGSTVQSAVTTSTSTHPCSYIQLILGANPGSNSVGTASGAGAAVAVNPMELSSSTAAGSGTISGVAQASFFAVGSASGVGSASAVPLGATPSTGTSAGAGAASGVGAVGMAAVGMASGAGAASAIGITALLSAGMCEGEGEASADPFLANARTAVASGAGHAGCSGVMLGRVLPFDIARAWAIDINGSIIFAVQYDPITFVLRVIYNVALTIDVGDLPNSITNTIESSPDPQAYVLALVAAARN